MSTQLRSPLSWQGGKARLAERIITAFPSASSYDVFCEVFCGGCSVLFAKPPNKHLEAINDLNDNLINFWMQVREEAEYLQWKLKTLPYAESLFKRYKDSLDSHEELEPVEQAARWYYVNRCTIMGHNDSSKGWAYAGPTSKITKDVPSVGVKYQNAVDLLSVITERLKRVQIHSCDFARMIEKYQSPLTLFYCDPPYYGVEEYYTSDDTPLFTRDDHKRLAQLLNETPAMVALSYYDCPELDELYPRSKWKRREWTTYKDTSRMNSTLQVGHEVLLINYQPASQSLWSEEVPA